MSMAALIDGHAIERQAEIDTMIEIDAAQKILIGLAFTTVLADDQSRHNLENLTRASNHTRVDLRLSDRTFICSIRRTQQAVTRTENLDCWQAANVIAPCHGRTAQKQDSESVNLTRTARGARINHD